MVLIMIGLLGEYKFLNHAQIVHGVTPRAPARATLVIFSFSKIVLMFLAYAWLLLKAPSNMSPGILISFLFL